MDLLLKRDGKVHDLVFVNGACPTTSGRADAAAQRLYIRLRSFKGEWFLNEEHGVPWLEEVLGKKVRKSTVDMIIQSTILDVVGVKKLIKFESTFNNKTREYECRFVVMSDDGNFTEEIVI